MTAGGRNAFVLVLTLVVVGLLMLFPTSWNHTGTHVRPGSSAPAGVQGTSARPSPRH